MVEWASGLAMRYATAARRALFVLLALLMAGMALAQQDATKPLVVGSEEDYPPFAMGNSDQAAGGFTVDLWKAVAAEHGLNYTIRVRPFREILDEFKAGKIDVLINLAQSEERRAFADFSVPHVIVHGAIFVRRGESRIRSEADLAGKSIIVIDADLAHDYAVSKGWEKQLVLVSTAADGLKLLASGQHDAMLLSKLAGMQTLRELKIRNLGALDAKAGFSQKFSFAVQKGNSELLAKVNEGLALAKSSGTYDALYEKWFGVFEGGEVTFRHLLKYLGPIAVALLILLVMFLIRQHERTKSEASLRESAERYRKLFEVNPHPMWAYDLESLRFLAVNAAAIAHYGYSREEFLAMTIKDIRPLEDVPSLLANLSTVNEGLDRAGVWRHRKRDGTIIDVEITSHVLDFDGRRAEVVLASDVTERLRSEIRSTGERAVLELISSTAPLDLVLDRLVRSKEELFPKMICTIMLLDADGKHLRCAATPSLPEAFRNAVDGLEIGPQAGSCGTAAFTRQTTVVADIASDPRWRDFRDLALAHGLRACWSVPLLSSNGRVLGTFAIYYREPASPRPEEISAIERSAYFASLAIERHDLLRSLQESQIRLQTLVSNLPGMAYRCKNDPNWTMTYVSEGCEAITSYPREELENNRAIAYADLVHPDDRDWLWAKCQASLDARTPCQNEYRIIDKHGRERWVSERASGVYADHGTLAFIDGFIQDITAARQAQREREQIDRKMQETQKLESLGVLAGGIAHDFNNLLTSVLGNASIAELELPPESSVHDCIQQITEASLRAADLCKQMLAYSGRGRFVVQKLDLGELVERTAQMLQISISKKAVLRYHIEKGLPPVEIDATQIRQVIMNLVINASEAIGDKSGTIAVSTGCARVDRDYLRGTLMHSDLPEGDYVFLEVADSGCGMSPETQAKIFDPFFTTKFTGRGLGLAAVLGIVRGHKGGMKVDSELGRGTTFKLLFPAAAGDIEPSKVPLKPVPHWRGAGTVLIVDDEETMRSTVARMARMVGLDPVLATDGRDAVQIFRASPGQFALVLLDLTMPHLDGEQTFAELRKLNSDVRVVLMSGFNAHEVLVRFDGKGLAGFLQKPFTIDALQSTIREVLEGKNQAES